MGKRRRRSKEVRAETCSNTLESTVVVNGNEELKIEPWKSNVFACPPHTNIQRDFQRSWQSLEQRKRRQLTPTPIQLHVWSFWASTSKNIVGIAPTSSGKTLSYALPLVCQEEGNSLVLVPTRELARQVEREVSSISCNKQNILCIYGGVDRSSQVQALTNAIQDEKPWIITATTGRLVDILQDESLSDLKVDSIIIDEADRMALNTDMAQQVDDIVQTVSSSTDTASTRVSLFSATAPLSVGGKWKDWIGEDSVSIKVNTTSIGNASSQASATREAPETPNVPSVTVACVAASSNTKQLDFGKIPPHVKQILHVCATHKKPRKLLTTLKKIRQEDGKRRNKALCVVFFSKIKTLQYISKLLQQEGYKTAELHSQMSQSARDRTLLNFKSGKVPTLLASDIAARGIHVKNIEFVINYDFPSSLEQYVHRCGRAGRDNTSTAAIYSFFTRNFAPMAKDVLALLDSSNAWIDPNLRELVVGSSVEEKRPGKKQRREQKEKHRADSNTDGNEAVKEADDNESPQHDDSDGDDMFANLNANRVVLKRASNVSDASSESEGEDDGES